ncbi:MAG TPA: TolC family protein [Tepidisphaeraceae bacterium]|nr:TolC family protein [Tepidisphaeraceae bacterium]
MHHSIFRTILSTAALGPLLLAGCSAYHEAPLDPAAVEQHLATPTDRQLQAQADEIKHPLLKPIQLDPRDGMSPDEAAILAVILNPTLRADRNRRDLAHAELIRAGILPNPQLSYNYDVVTGGNTEGAVNAWGLGLSWDVTSLISHETKLNAAKAGAAAVNLDIAWQEWQIAEAARTAVYDLLALQGQLAVAQDVDRRLQENLNVVGKAVDEHLKTALDLAAAEAAARDSHALVLQNQRDIDHQRLQLNRAIGLPPGTRVKLTPGIVLPSRFDPPPLAELIRDLEERRLDLLGLKRGYQSQDQTLRAAILDQFPRINIGFNRANDNTNVHSLGPAVTIDLPIFDRNQANIAAESATRKKLLDEYIARVYDARADIASAIDDIRSINEQIKDAEAAVPNLQHLVDTYREATDRGNADVLSYYEAWNNLARKNLDVLKLKQQLADNRIALEIAAGRYCPDTAENPATQPTALAESRTNP